MSIDTPLESATLKQLQQTPIDNVLHIIDEGLVHLPTYRELYYRWERQQRSEEHTSELQSHSDLVCRLLLEKKKKTSTRHPHHGHQKLNHCFGRRPNNFTMLK